MELSFSDNRGFRVKPDKIPRGAGIIDLETTLPGSDKVPRIKSINHFMCGIIVSILIL